MKLNYNNSKKILTIIQPICIIIDKETNSLIISDRENRRIMRCTYGNNTNREILISDIDCLGITTDKNGSLYVVDHEK
jgi:sugar lactone lactonase YvrE